MNYDGHADVKDQPNKYLLRIAEQEKNYMKVCTSFYMVGGVGDFFFHSVETKLSAK